VVVLRGLLGEELGVLAGLAATGSGDPALEFDRQSGDERQFGF